MFTKDTQGNLFIIEKSEVIVHQEYATYFLTCLDTDLEFLDTHIAVFHDEQLDNVLEMYDYDKHQNHLY